MINDHSEIMAELQGKIYKLRDLMNDKKWEQARNQCSNIEEDCILLWHWIDSKVKK